MKVSIIVVYFEGKQRLSECIKSIRNSKTKYKYEIIVVDNQGGKSTPLKLRGVKYLRSASNTGYGSGNNLGANEASGEYLFILNPDTKVIPGAINKLVEFLDQNKKAAVVAPNLLDEKGEIFPQLGSLTLTPLRGIVALSFINKILPNNLISRKYWLKNISMDELREVEAVPGSAFMIRKKIFEKVGGFDEKFFLFFEESDLGKRIIEKGHKLFISPKAKVMHYWGQRLGSERMKRYFTDSRFYYFKKHYGIFWAEIVEVFAEFSKWQAILLFTVTLGAFLRFFRAPQNLSFFSEIGHNYLAIKNFISLRNIPLVGPPTSHPWLSFGPLFYWLFTPILLLSNFNPLSGTYFMALASVGVIILNYWLVANWFGRKTAIVSSYLIAISPLWLWLARSARFFSLITLLIYPFFFFLVKAIRTGKGLFWAGIFLGAMFSFHFTPILLVFVAAIVLLLARESFTKRKVLEGFLGLIVPNIPVLIHEYQTNFSMTSKILLWIPYRAVGFLGIYPKNNLSPIVFKNNLVSIFEFFANSYSPKTSDLGAALAILSIFFLLVLVKETYLGKIKVGITTHILLIWTIAALAGLFIHGEPPIHYFVVIFPIPQIILAMFLLELSKKDFGRIVVFFVLAGLTIVNLRFYFSKDWFFTPQDKIAESGQVPFFMQLRTSRVISSNTKGEKFELQRIGPGDNFEGDFADNYRYLLWLMGSEPQEMSGTIYTIVEDGSIKVIRE